MIWQAAGVCGLHPDPFTLHELLLMHDSREMAEWNRAAQLIYYTANAWRAERDQIPMREIHPYFDRLPVRPPAEPIPDAPEGIQLLKIFVDRRPLDS